MPYKLTHAETGAEIEVDASMVSTYETQGWEKSPNAVDPEPTDELAKKK